MTRLVAEHFNPDGRPKRSFAYAFDCAKYLEDKDWVGLFGYYRCKFCGHWHLTSRKNKAKSRRFS
jgi:hypothetical protein